jgi:hypothetical protein
MLSFWTIEVCMAKNAIPFSPPPPQPNRLFIEFQLIGTISELLFLYVLVLIIVIFSQMNKSPLHNIVLCICPLSTPLQKTYTVVKAGGIFLLPQIFPNYFMNITNISEKSSPLYYLGTSQ